MIGCVRDGGITFMWCYLLGGDNSVNVSRALGKPLFMHLLAPISIPMSFK